MAEFAAEALFDQVGETFAQRVEVDSLQHIVDEGVLEEQAGLLLGDTALAEIEQSAFIEFTDRRTVVALHIVGINLQHRLRVHFGRGRNADVGTCLLRERLLCTRTHEHFSGKGGFAFAVEHIFVEHIGGAGFSHVLDEDAVVHALVAIGNHRSCGLTVGTATEEAGIDHRARNSGEQGDGVDGNAAVGLLLYVDVGEARVVGVCLFERVEVHLGSGGGEDFRHLRTKVAVGTFGMFAKEEVDLAVFLGHYEHAAVGHEVGIGRSAEHHLQRAVALHTRGNVHKDAVLHQ